MRCDQAVGRCLSKYLVCSGRARPAEFWWFMALYLPVLAATVAARLGGSELVLPGALAVLTLTPPALAVAVRRLHDIGASGWMLVFLVPLAGQVLLLAWLARPSVPRLNRFGPQPGSQRQQPLLYAR